MKSKFERSTRDLIPLSPTFGALFTGQTDWLRHREKAVFQIFLSFHKVLVFRGLDLKPKDLLQIGRFIGDLIPFVDKEYHHPDHPEIFVVSNTKRNGKRFGMDRVGRYWHSDSSFLASPQPITMLYAQETPFKGGNTAFIDMAAVLTDMPKEQRLNLALQDAVHEGQWRYIISEKDVGLSVEELLERDRKEVPPVAHPMVIHHPITKVQSLYINEGFTKRILGLSAHESERQLSSLFSTIAQSPRRFEHNWQKGDLVIWDNRSVVHKAFPATAGNRVLYRLGIKDGPFYLPDGSKK